MSNQVSLNDVSLAANVSISTVSLVVNGKADRRRISPATQERVTAVARQLGYQPNQIARDIVLGRGKPLRGIPDNRIQTTDPRETPIGVVISTISKPEILALVPDIEAVLKKAGIPINVVIVPNDPAAIHTRVSQLIQEGAIGMLCCPSVYPTVSAMATEVVPAYPPEPWRRRVIVLWQGAGQAMMRAIEKPGSSEAFCSSPIPPVQMVSPVKMEGAAPSAPVNMPATEEPVPVASVPPPTPINAAVTEHRPPLIQEPVVITPPEPEPVPEPVLPPVQVEGAAPSAPVSMPAAEEPVPVASVPPPAPINAAVTEHCPPFIQEPVVEPVTTPDPVVVEMPPPMPEIEEEPA